MVVTSPLIGITGARFMRRDGIFLCQVSDAYITGVVRAGGMPVVLPVGMPPDRLEELFARIDGVLFTGGPDIDPDLYGGSPHPAVYGVDRIRDEQEINLVRLAVQVNKPFFGICRGNQVINVALGGTLYSDIHDQVPGSLCHDNDSNHPRDFLAHTVRIEQPSCLYKALGAAETPVNSLHHQAVAVLAPPLHPIAFSPDHLVEAVVLPGHCFGLGVQWHPECLPELAAQQSLFRSFIDAASH